MPIEPRVFIDMQGVLEQRILSELVAQMEHVSCTRRPLDDHRLGDRSGCHASHSHELSNAAMPASTKMPGSLSAVVRPRRSIDCKASSRAVPTSESDSDTITS